jgi:peptidoglycan biosynthesis protein MviN/MurJ (putative lipid II flippase)
MAPVALVLALGAVVAATLPSPGLFIAIGLGPAAIGLGWIGFRRAGDPGFRRLAAAAAITVGALGLALGALRLALVLAALDRLDHLLG